MVFFIFTTTCRPKNGKVQRSAVLSYSEYVRQERYFTLLYPCSTVEGAEYFSNWMYVYMYMCCYYNPLIQGIRVVSWYKRSRSSSLVRSHTNKQDRERRVYSSSPCRGVFMGLPFGSSSSHGVTGRQTMFSPRREFRASSLQVDGVFLFHPLRETTVQTDGE